MAWRPSSCLRYGVLDNRVAGKVTVYIAFHGLKEPCIFDLDGDFHEDIRGCLVELKGNDDVSDYDIKGLNKTQKGNVGDMTIGDEVTLTKDVWETFNDDAKRKYAVGEKYTPYVEYPYFEWYSKANGRVVLELDKSQVKIVERKQMKNSRVSNNSMDLMAGFMAGMAKAFEKQNEKE